MLDQWTQKLSLFAVAVITLVALYAINTGESVSVCLYSFKEIPKTMPGDAPLCHMGVRSVVAIRCTSDVTKQVYHGGRHVVVV